MVISEIKDKNIWESFLLGCKEKTFLQSWNWGEFQKLMGNKIWRLGIYDDSDLKTVSLIVKIQAKRGNFLMIQHCLGMPETLLVKLKEIAKEENCSFIRVAPLLERNEENIKFFKNLGFHHSPMHVNAYEATWKLDISITEEELLMNMRKTTRYLIRQAMKNSELEVIKSNKLEDVKIFNELNQKIAKYQKFVPFSFDFIKNEFEVFSRDNQTLLFFGKYKGEIIAGALIIFWSEIGFYHQAVRDPKYDKIPAVYLIQWEAIKEAKNRGCKLYDFWGYIDPKENPGHPWAGPTLFKMGFGGYKKEYLKTQDLSLSKKYWLTYFFEKLRKIKRGL